MLIGGQAEFGPGFARKFGAALAVRLLRAGHLGNALADERLGDDELRLTAPGRAGSLERLVGQGLHVT